MSLLDPNQKLNGKTRMLRAARREPVDRPPVWIMRQAGRYLPEYHTIRSKGTFMETVRDPARAAEITLQPIRRFGMDAAVIFSDILVPCAAMGLDVQFHEGQGPVLHPPLRSDEDVKRLSAFDPEVSTAFLAESIRRVRQELGDERAIVGFCGAPFTTASYMIEGRSSRNFEHTKAMMYGQPKRFRELLDRIVDALIPYLALQVEAGADLLQIFDSWGGTLDARTYERVLGEPLERLICAAKSLGAPIILYVNGCAHLLELLADLGPDVVGIDWRVDPAFARRTIGQRVALQGNLDPVALYAPVPVVEQLTRDCLDAFGDAPGHIFNLGSGMLPTIPVESLAAVVSVVQSRGQGR
ncbi:MAG TPA: uroporphyrinogen decarboxylase [Planctomycetota bacterium]|nr:uroporphyrinogen decarboxylase [Planctomycetota bacterium]